ncbi:nucleotidyl transferase AbiEii/AbiGii toxin family protein [Streptomyces sioyaensis]|uniref:nucleotidyl transferase AbiEii/AbiGii toxin family protein n=1 Tax=Streptomyces sioyaensis TaxID=67364 RepID=UPI0037D646E6
MEQRRGSWEQADWTALPTADQHLVQSIAVVLSSIDRLLPPHAWHLKGSTALMGWMGSSARLPNDVDLALSERAGRLLLSASELPPGPQGESLRLLRSEPVVFSSPGRATVHRALIRLRAGEAIGKVLLNILLVPDAEAARDNRTAPLDFPGRHAPITVPAATLSRCLAQKLLRYTRRRDGGKINTRWTDLTDFLLAAASPLAPALLVEELRRDVAIEFAAMGRTWPDHLPQPPREWLDFWDTATFRDGLEFGRLPEAVDRLAQFWNPVLGTRVAPYGPSPAPVPPMAPQVWSSSAWKWATA